MHHELSLRITGFIASLILTLVAYFIILNLTFLAFDVKTAVIVIFILAITQSIVQLFFFIDVWKEKEPLWNLGIFLSWIINHLNYHMH